MRELGFSKDWWNFIKDAPKLSFYEFTTFRFPRKDRDWELNEAVKIVMKPRSKDRIVLGVATIISIEGKDKWNISDIEAKADGFKATYDDNSKAITMPSGNMLSFLLSNPKSIQNKIINKLTLHWQVWYTPMIQRVRG